MTSIKKQIKVSVLCITFNQIKYIKQCLDSIVNQKTKFSFEVLINDDASTDGTKEVIEQYQKKYPNLIKPVFHRENQYSKGDMSLFVGNLFHLVNGQYLALCEGDDYWIDDNKLQKQVDFLDKNPDYSICFNRSKIIFEKGESEDSYYPDYGSHAKYNIEELLKSNFISTNSVMYRKQDYKNMRTDLLPQDLYMHLFHAQFGKIGFIDEVMSVYRRHEAGIWWASHSNRMDELYKKQHLMLAGFYDELEKMFGSTPRYEKIISGHIYYLLSAFIDLEKRTNINIFNNIIKKYPNLIEVFVNIQNKEIIDQHKELNLIESKRKELDESVQYLSQKIDNIYKSRSFKIAKRLSLVAAKFKNTEKK